MIKKQWFVKMDELIKPAVKAVQDKEIRLIPERMEKTYFNWTDNIKDWCISRQLWWGTQNSGLLLRFLRRNRGSAHRADCLPEVRRHTFYTGSRYAGYLVFIRAVALSPPSAGRKRRRSWNISIRLMCS